MEMMLVLMILQTNCHSQINNKLEEDTGLALKIGQKIDIQLHLLSSGSQG